MSHKPLKVFLYSSYTLIEYLLFAWFIILNTKSAKGRRAMIIISAVFSLFSIIYTLNVHVKRIDSVPIGVEAILIMIFSFYYFFEQMNDTTNFFIYSRYSFWIVLGMMLYLAGSFFIYIYASQLPIKEVAKYWIFTNIFSIIKNILFAIAIIVGAKNTITKQSPNYPAYTLN